MTYILRDQSRDDDDLTALAHQLLSLAHCIMEPSLVANLEVRLDGPRDDTIGKVTL